MHYQATDYSFTKIHPRPAGYFVVRNSFECAMAKILPCFSIATQSEMGKTSGVSEGHNKRGRKIDEIQLFDSLVNPKGRTDRPSEGFDEKQNYCSAPHFE